MNPAADSLRAAVFGITRSGKDFSIRKTVDSLREAGIPFEHFPGIPTVRDYSMPILGKEFSLTSKDEKGRLMEAFRNRISDRAAMPFLIQDEHYSFPTAYGGKPLNNEYTGAKFPFVVKRNDEGTREYEVMLEERWISDCDMAFYLNPDAGEIFKRIRSSDGSKRNAQITEEDIELWKKFEIDSLRRICGGLGIPLDVISVNDGAAARIIQRISDAV